MSRRTFALAVMLLACTALSAQQMRELEVRRVEADSLLSFLRKEFTPRIYYLSSEIDHSSFTLSAPREQFFEKALDELRAKEYIVSEYDGAWFVTRSKGLVQDLPAGYFDKGGSNRDNGELLKYIEDQNTMFTFQNKVYEIGEKVEGRTGKVIVSGYVHDVSSGEPLTGVAVYDDATGAYSLTDAYGFYRILLPVGEGVLNFSGYSMDDLHLNVIVYGEGGLDVVMKEKVTSLKGAVVSAESRAAHRDARMGIERIRVSEIAKVPVAFGEADVLKVVLTLPGVKTAGEASSGFNVRGGSVDQNLVLFNGGTIYNPSHMFGIMSAFNTDVVNEVELYKSSIPAEFGGRISSVLDIRGREGNSKKVQGSLGLGLLTSRLNLEGPIGENTSFIMGGRTTYSNWILNLLPSSSNYSGGKASFSDAYIGLSHRFNSKNSLHANGYWSRDGFSFSGDTTFRYSNITASLKWHSDFSDRHSMELTGGFDRYDNSHDNTFNAWEAYTLDTEVNQMYAKLRFKSLAGSAHSLLYGFNFLFYDLNPGTMIPFGEMSRVVLRSLDRQRGVEPALFASDTWTLDEKLSFDAGIRFAGFKAMEQSRFYGGPEFRVSGKYSFLPTLSLKAGFNTMRQYIHLLSNSSSISPMDAWTLSSDRIRPQTGWQAAGGLYWTVSDGKIDLSLESYYKQMLHYLDYKSGATLIMNDNLPDDLVETRGKAYGVEFMVKKSIGKLNGWMSYTYSRTFLQEMEDRGVQTINGGDWYPAPHDKPHDFKLVGNYKFTHRYSLSVNVDYSTGRPVTIPIGKYVYGGGTRLAYSQRNGYRIPDYFRMDLAMNIEPGHYLKKLTHMSVTFGVYNVTGRKNAYSVFYNTAGGSKVAGHMISVFSVPVPYVNLNLKF
ncbi:MAG: TonB-dependent receptor plug domain-containing protein [Bacteroidales bacterium]|nr:TonB-dependent receptor plug domain-containing protein [Bacteroidales bacterium]